MLPVTNSKGKYISVLDLESQFEWIQADAKHSDGEHRPAQANDSFSLDLLCDEKFLSCSMLAIYNLLTY